MYVKILCGFLSILLFSSAKGNVDPMGEIGIFYGFLPKLTIASGSVSLERYGVLADIDFMKKSSVSPIIGLRYYRELLSVTYNPKNFNATASLAGNWAGIFVGPRFRFTPNIWLNLAAFCDRVDTFSFYGHVKNTKTGESASLTADADSILKYGIDVNLGFSIWSALNGFVGLNLSKLEFSNVSVSAGSPSNQILTVSQDNEIDSFLEKYMYEAVIQVGLMASF